MFALALVVLIIFAASANDKRREEALSIATETSPVIIYPETDIKGLTPDGSLLLEVETEPVKETEPPLPEYYSEGLQHYMVANIQQRLMDLGFMDNDEPTDYYGAVTKASVIKFQRQLGIVKDGVCGPDTFAKLMSDDAPHYAVSNGDSGDDIIIIQQRLYQLGYLASDQYVTGNFGDKTEEAVLKLQEVNGILRDGKVGMETINLIYSDEIKPNLLSFGEKSETVLTCQRRLFELGYMTTKPDGEYGNDTSVAVKTFQRKNALVVDGYLGPETRDVLMSADALPNGLGLGDENDMVKSVQKLLAKWEYLSSGNVTGYFGEKTLSAVKAFQERNGLKADGLVGAKTLAKLSSSDVKKPAQQSSSQQSSGASSETSSAVVTPDTSSAGVSSGVAGLLEIARSKIGCPYVYGAKGPNSFDCSGFVYWCLNQAGISQSYITSYGWRTVGKYTKISNYGDLRAGDIIVVSGHVGIVSTDGNVVDASSANGHVIERDLGKWWKNNFIVGWRIY